MPPNTNTAYDGEMLLGTCYSNGGPCGTRPLLQHECGKCEHRFFQITDDANQSLPTRGYGITRALTIFVAYAPTPRYEEVEAFHTDLELIDSTLHKVIFSYSKIGSGKTSDRTEGDYKDRRSCSMKDSHASKQTAFQKGFSTIDHIHAVSRLIEVSREYKMPLCLDFLDLEKAVDSIETERILELSDNQRVPTQYIKVLRE
ncbi:hypothetical protein RB195_023555 [Necator americanus]|uniref:Uncharacterized protein n=1 Tax=Necator americanus TaxID=51031 RepID=A0ABR1EJV8_NECAM